jgi:TRAP-type C4-dicarboxylate transport system substrate-binding protein
VAVELNEAIDLISRLEVDAQENPLANTVAYGVDRVHRHVTMTGHLYGARGLFSHRLTWDDFEPDLRRVVSQAARTAIEVQRRAATAMESALRLRLENDGIEFVDLTDEERSVFVESSEPAIALAHEELSGEVFELARP